MTVAAIILARGGSRAIPRKNLVPLGGIPLLAHTIQQAKAEPMVDMVVVSSDDQGILQVAVEHGALGLQRPEWLARDETPSEPALLHALEAIHPMPEEVVFLQCTSPFRALGEIGRAITFKRDGGFDSVFSATLCHVLYWQLLGSRPFSFNFNYLQRPRRQDMRKMFLENGNLYIFDSSGFVEAKNRLFGKIGIFLSDYWSQFQVDEPADLELCQAIFTMQKVTSGSPT